jgi:hypothetical protein
MKTFVDAQPMPSVARRLAPCLYLVAFILIVVPLFDAAISTLPFRPGNVQWRFGAIGLLSSTLLTPGLGFLLAVVTAVTLQHVLVQRVLAILSWVAVAAVLALLVLFTLDALQTRPMVRPEMRMAFIVASTTAAGKLLLWTITFGVFGRACRVPRAMWRNATSPAASMLIRDSQASASTVGRS